MAIEYFEHHVIDGVTLLKHAWRISSEYCHFCLLLPYGAQTKVRVSLARKIHSLRLRPEQETDPKMITCYLRYMIDPDKLDDFETYAKAWIPLVNKFGGIHHGYFLPKEGANNIALALFSFPSLAAYEEYRAKAATDAECQTAMAHYQKTRCFNSYERSFMRPILE